MRRPKVFESKNARAVSLLKSWLRVLHISYQTGTVPGVDLVVWAQNGRLVSVHVRVGGSRKVPRGTVILDGGLMTGRGRIGIRPGLALFASFVSSLGYKPISPVSRGEAPEKRLCYQDNFEHIVMRHTDLRRVPNPPKEHLEAYMDVIHAVTTTFQRMNAQFCSDHMYEFGDLLSFSMGWTVTYIGLYEVPFEDVTDDNNERKLHAYIVQCFREFRATSDRKGRNIFASLDVASIGQHGEVYDYGSKLSWQLAQDEEEYRQIDEAYVNRRCQLDLTDEKTRRASARQLLDKHLGALPHDKLVEVLGETAENTRMDPGACEEARKRLKTHWKGCGVCLSKGPQPDIQPCRIERRSR